jgi:hypothetical protein
MVSRRISGDGVTSLGPVVRVNVVTGATIPSTITDFAPGRRK